MLKVITVSSVLLAFAFVVARPVGAEVLINEVGFGPDPAALQIELYNDSSASFTAQDISLNNEIWLTELVLQPFEFRTISWMGINPTEPANQNFTLSLMAGSEVDEVVVEFDETTSWQRNGPICPEGEKAAPTFDEANTHLLENCWDFDLNVTLPGVIVAGEAVHLVLQPHNPAILGVSYFGRQLSIGENLVQVAATPDGIFSLDMDTVWGGRLGVIPNVRVIPKLVITEIFSNPEGSDTDKEWLEIYNPQNFEVRMENLGIYVKDKLVHQFGQDTVMPALGYIQVYLAKSPLPNCSKQPCAEKVELKYAELAVDQVTYNQSYEAKSWSKLSDGLWTWDYPLTPGKPNELPHVPNTVSVNELYPRLIDVEDEWVELFNMGTEAVNLQGWWLADTSGKHLLSGIIDPGGYFLVKPKFSLNDSGDQISLHHPYEGEVSRAEYPELEKGSVWARDNLGNFHESTAPTPGALNSIVPVVITPKLKTPPKKSTTVNPKPGSISKPKVLGSVSPAPSYIPVSSFSVAARETDYSDEGLSIAPQAMGLSMILAQATLFLTRKSVIFTLRDWWLLG